MAAKKKKTSKQVTQKRQRTSPDDDIEIQGIKKAKDLKPKGRNKPSKYDHVIDTAIRLKPGEVLEIAIVGNKDPVYVRNRISAVIRRLAQPRTEYRLRIKLTENDSVGIYCTRHD